MGFVVKGEGSPKRKKTKKKQIISTYKDMNIIIFVDMIHHKDSFK